MYTLKTVLSMVSALDDITIHDGHGVIRYNGACSDFRATMSEADKAELLSAEVSCIRPYKSILVILLK